MRCGSQLRAHRIYYCGRMYCLRDNYHCSFLLCSLTTIFRGNEHGANFYLDAGDVWPWRRDARVVSCRDPRWSIASVDVSFLYACGALLPETSSFAFQGLRGARRYSFEQVRVKFMYDTLYTLPLYFIVLYFTVLYFLYYISIFIFLNYLVPLILSRNVCLVFA